MAKGPPYSAIAVANSIIDLYQEEFETIDPMRLQKIAYIAHGWHLALYDQPLIDDRIEAWTFGPVIPRIYHAFKKYGGDLIRGVVWSRGRIERIPRQDERAHALLRRISRSYRDFDSIQLSVATHQEGTPWKKARDGVPRHARDVPIPDDLIKKYYRELADKNVQKRRTARG